MALEGLRSRHTLGEKGLALCRKLGDKECTAYTLMNLGIVAMRQENYERAKPLFDESLRLSHELANDYAHGTVLVNVGIMARYQGDYERAAALNTQGLALLRRVGAKWGIAYALSRLGFVAVHQGNYGQAAASFTESLILCRETGNRWVSEECLEGLARLACVKGHCEQAARLFGAAEVLREAVGWHRALPDQAHHDRYVASARAGLEETAFAAAWAAGRAMTPEQAIEYGLAFTGPEIPTGQRQPAKGPEADPLTPREREVARLVAEGQTNRQIAATLVISERTADAHVQNILNKLGFSSRAQIAAWAVERGLLASPLSQTAISDVPHRPAQPRRST